MQVYSYSKSLKKYYTKLRICSTLVSSERSVIFVQKVTLRRKLNNSLISLLVVSVFDKIVQFEMNLVIGLKLILNDLHSSLFLHSYVHSWNSTGQKTKGHLSRSTQFLLNKTVFYLITLVYFFVVYTRMTKEVRHAFCCL